jgi:hypothetical protein
MIASGDNTMRVIYTRLLITGALLAALAALGTLDMVGPAESPTAIHAAVHP